MTEQYNRRHQAQHAASDTDKTEFQAFRIGSKAIDASIHDQQVAGVLDDLEDVADVEEIWHSGDLRSEKVIGDIREEISRRIRIMGEAYPFTLNDGSLTYTQSENSVYEFFLSICNAFSITQGELTQLPRTFERVSARIVATSFGKHAQHIHIGSPRDPAVGISFVDAMETVSQRTGEWIWGPDEGLTDSSFVKDGGCDFVVWPDFLDDRKGKLFILGQCACGNNWETKLGELNLKELQKWFNPLSVVGPVRAFATPHHVTDAMLAEASRQGGVFFDRARLTLLAHKNKEQAINERATEMMQDVLRLLVD